MENTISNEETAKFIDRNTLIQTIATKLAHENAPQYNFDKLSEELIEAADVLAKMRTKSGTDKAPKMSDLIEELGDVMLRIKILSYMTNIEDDIIERMAYKASKYDLYRKDKKYTGRI